MFNLRLAVLVALMIVELCLVWLLRSVNIDRLTESTRWWITLLAALLPLLLAMAVLFRNGLRIRLRSVMYATVLFAAFLSVIVAPLSKERMLRRGAAALDVAGIMVHDALETEAGETNSLHVTDRSRILEWLAPVLGNIDHLPTDKRIRSAALAPRLRNSLQSNPVKQFRFRRMPTGTSEEAFGNDGRRVLRTRNASQFQTAHSIRIRH